MNKVFALIPYGGEKRGIFFWPIIMGILSCFFLYRSNYVVGSIFLYFIPMMIFQNIWNMTASDYVISSNGYKEYLKRAEVVIWKISIIIYLAVTVFHIMLSGGESIQSSRIYTTMGIVFIFCSAINRIFLHEPIWGFCILVVIVGIISFDQRIMNQIEYMFSLIDNQWVIGCILIQLQYPIVVMIRELIGNHSIKVIVI